MKGFLLLLVLYVASAAVTFHPSRILVRIDDDILDDKSPVMDPEEDVTCQHKKTGWCCEASMNKETASLFRKIYIICDGKIVDGEQNIDTETCTLVFDIRNDETFLFTLALPILALVLLLGAFVIRE